MLDRCLNYGPFVSLRSDSFLNSIISLAYTCGLLAGFFPHASRTGLGPRFLALSEVFFSMSIFLQRGCNEFSVATLGQIVSPSALSGNKTFSSVTIANITSILICLFLRLLDTSLPTTRCLWVYLSFIYYAYPVRATVFDVLPRLLSFFALRVPRACSNQLWEIRAFPFSPPSSLPLPRVRTLKVLSAKNVKSDKISRRKNPITSVLQLSELKDLKIRWSARRECYMVCFWYKFSSILPCFQ